MSMNWDAGSRRESRIPKAPFGSNGGDKPLAEKQNTMDRKRRGAPLESVPESKRPTRGTDKPAAAKAAPAAADKPPAAEETFEDIQERTGMSVQDVLNKKLGITKSTLAAKKVDLMGPYIKELRAVGWHLQSLQERSALDAQQWKQHCEELEAAGKQREAEWEGGKAGLEQQLEELKGELAAAGEQQAALKAEQAAAQQRAAETALQLSALQQQLEGAAKEVEGLKAQVAERDAKLVEMDGVVRQSQAYSSTLQSYNTSLQNDVTAEKAKREEVVKQREELTAKVAELGGTSKSLERLLALEQETASKLRLEREAACSDVAVLRTDLDSTRGDRERLTQELKEAREELDRFKEKGGKSQQTLAAMENNQATLEAQLATSRGLLDAMRRDLAAAKEAAALAESLASSRGTELGEAKAQIATLSDGLTDAERRVYESELIRRKLHNTIQELKGNIRVFCRVRPPANHELTDGGASGVATDFPTSGEAAGRGIDLAVAPGQKYSFTFDKVFDPAADQAAVFEEISELVQSALDGHKVCIFAYGQTGSGKTYTMLGNEEQRGIIPRAIQQVFEASRALTAQGWSFTMVASMMEVYNEEYRDLLARKKGGEGKTLRVTHDAAGNTHVSDLTLITVDGPGAVEGLLERARERRSVGCTALNEESSRSHAVFKLVIEGVNSASQLKVQGQLNLIDLAGSERVKDSGATGQRLKEAQNINKSLSALGDVIMALANKADHIPYRNSKLTWLLQPCLGGDAKTLMFVNLSPASEYAQESLCSLRFAAKVNACEVGVARRNVKTA